MKKIIYSLCILGFLFAISYNSINIFNNDKSASEWLNQDVINESDLLTQKTCKYGTCWGTTNAGYSCNNCAKKGSSYCGTHQRKNIHDNKYRYTSDCQAIAKSTGVQCRNKAKNGGMYCGVHD